VLSWEDYLTIRAKHKEFCDDYNTCKKTQRDEQLHKMGITTSNETNKDEDFYGQADSIYTIDNTAATIFYIIVMFVGAIFVDRLIIWIIATLIWLRHINRNKRK
jgi:hypothetical protein